MRGYKHKHGYRLPPIDTRATWTRPKPQLASPPPQPPKSASSPPPPPPIVSPQPIRVVAAPIVVVAEDPPPASVEPRKLSNDHYLSDKRRVLSGLELVSLYSTPTYIAYVSITAYIRPEWWRVIFALVFDAELDTITRVALEQHRNRLLAAQKEVDTDMLTQLNMYNMLDGVSTPALSTLVCVCNIPATQVAFVFVLRSLSDMKIGLVDLWSKGTNAYNFRALINDCDRYRGFVVTDALDIVRCAIKCLAARYVDYKSGAVSQVHSNTNRGCKDGDHDRWAGGVKLDVLPLGQKNV